MKREELLAVSNEQLKIDQYPFAVRPLSEEDGGGYLVKFTDVPGCISDGASPEEAILNGRDALRCMLLTMMEFGDRVPEPGSLVPLAVPAVIHDRLSAVAGKRHVRPEELGSDLIAQALDREPAA